ncbi:F-box/kelch-repeat protein At3g23880-like [Spinacia oleracea]|uniref:F-box/kelch-repeat protein At3g23880-like n=1 Tax=Spinacia oleracea TaxID=3562 RepID=A0ABM3RNF2_SPIOL|nr:F-box/kelch-repeat protein At3g23880-like [Spinacia oleracea]
MADKSSNHEGGLSLSKYCKLVREILQLKPKQKKNRVTILPLELESNILERISVEPLLRFKCVCKRWRDEIKSPSFIKSHTSQFQIHNANSTSFILFSSPHLYSTNFHKNSTTLNLKKLGTNFVPIDFTCVIGSCNGLLCFRKINCDYPGPIYSIRLMIYNPITGTTFNNAIVPHYGTHSWRYMVGFGYDRMRDDYKIFYSSPLKDGHVGKGIQPAMSWVYSLKKKSWKSIQPPPHRYNLSLRMVTSNNVLYWIGVKPNTYDNCIFGFDFETEEYHEVIPPPDFNFRMSEFELVSLRGCLHLVSCRLYDGFANGAEISMNIWGLKNYGSNRTWVKLIHRVSLKQVIQTELENKKIIGNPRSRSIYLHYSPLPFAYSEDESEILIGLGKTIKAFIRCDLRNGELKRVDVNGAPNGWKYGYEGISWTASLVSISSSTS